MDQYLTSLGSSALSDFRRRRLAASLGVTDVHARYVHYVSLHGSHSKEKAPNYSHEALDRLLLYGDPFCDKSRNENESSTFFVTPRTSTISPWSSQATNIAQNCGFGNAIKRIERGTIFTIIAHGEYDHMLAAKLIHDPMTESISTNIPDLEKMFAEGIPAPAKTISLHDPDKDPRRVLQDANKSLGLALDESEIEYLIKAFVDGPLARSPSDVELFMFSQINSEHCRHKQFNASWTIDGVEKPHTLFQMIRNTHATNPDYVVSAYSDNAAILRGEKGSFLAPSHHTGEWTHSKEIVHYIAKVESHNHPTAVSPFPGAATGSGGELRDEGACGRGSKPKAGLCGFAVSDLLIPGFQQPWELDVGKPPHIASALDIMLEAPIGSAAFNNEFGRACLTGYFRTFLSNLPLDDGKSEFRGYYKPIMIAGGVGTVRPQHALKDPGVVEPGCQVIVLGGPAMLIGLGGGAASSLTSAEGSADLDFASVQRGNAEVQRRAQEVINACTAMGFENPIKFIHDVGAGGLSNALPELVHDSGLGADFELREIDNADRGMSPLQIWCCEAQERYVMAIAQDGLNIFKSVAHRERCGFSLVGKTTGGSEEQRLLLLDRDSQDFPTPIDLPMSVLFGKPPKITRVVKSRKLHLPPFDSSLATYMPKASRGMLDEAVHRVLALPAVGSKSFLVTIADRSVGGVSVSDPMVGPWQTPVGNCGVTATSLTIGMRTGEAMAMGEKPTIALISPPASARMAVVEALMNIGAADLLDGLDRIRLSANWMASTKHPGESAALYEAVEAIGMKLCPQLGISIPVGKDSLSMQTSWTDQESKQARQVTSPLSLIITAFAPVGNIQRIWTPSLRRKEDLGIGETVLLMVDLAEGRKAMGGSALAQVFSQVGGPQAPDVHNVQLLKDYFDALSQLHESGIVLAYHDRSDGGLFTTLVELMFAGRCGLQIMLDDLCHSTETSDVIETLFNEELGSVFQVRKRDEINFKRCFATCGPPNGLIKKIGRIPPTSEQDLTMYHGAKLVYRSSRAALQQRWSSTSHQMQRLRDNPQCADAEFASILDSSDPGLSYNLTYNPAQNILPFTASLSNRLSYPARPRVAILREEGVNGHAEMAFAFMCAGFSAIDVHMTDIISGRVSLSSFKGLAACGGFSYGDVLGAGQGWAKSVLLHPQTREEFRNFFERIDTFTLGVCNGCQFLSRLKEIIPGTAKWPSFDRNVSEQYEARVSMVRISNSIYPPSVFLHGMDGSSLPIAVAHGEGRAHFGDSSSAQDLISSKQVALQYVDNRTLRPTVQYPANPNGSPQGIAGIRSEDGRVLALMPHCERTVLAGVGSWIPDGKSEEWGDLGPWARIFQSARRWVG